MVQMDLNIETFSGETEEDGGKAIWSHAGENLGYEPRSLYIIGSEVGRQSKCLNRRGRELQQCFKKIKWAADFRIYYLGRMWKQEDQLEAPVQVGSGSHVNECHHRGLGAGMQMTCV